MANKNVQDIYELSPLQQGMLFHSLKEPRAGLYTVQLGCTLTGPLDLASFEQAWQQVLARHSILRTAFFWKEADKPLQVVYKSAPLPLEVLDWRDLSGADQERRLSEWMAEDRRRGFDFGTAPLMRFTLIRLADDVYRFIWTYHHLLMDGWSLAMVMGEFFTLYETLRQQEPSPLGAAPPFRLYLQWLQQQDQDAAAAFWQEQMGDFTEPTPLPRARYSVGSGESAEQEIALDEATTEALRVFARTHGLTLNTLIQAAWAVLLGRYTGRDDVVFGAVVSGRPATLAGVEKIAGPFINTLPVRVKLPPAEALVPWLQAFQKQLVEMRQYEYSALVDIQGWSGAPRGVPLFESALAFENYPLDATLEEQRLSLRLSDVQDVEHTNFALSLLVWPGEQLTLKIAYDTDRFEGSVITRLLGHLKTVLLGMVADPEQPLAALPLLPEAERETLLRRWAREDGDGPPDVATIPALFERQVMQALDVTALVYNDQRLSYSQLNRQANQWAYHLQTLGVEPGDRVAIALPRSPAMVIAVLAVLKAGGAYVPLDLAYPKARLRFMLEDADVRLIITESASRQKLPSGDIPVSCHDEAGEALAAHPTTNPDVGLTPEACAYVIYTSGSTGKPKGVMAPHAGIGPMVRALGPAYTIWPGSQVLQFASFSFDAAVAEIFTPLLRGATLHLADADDLRPGAPLVALLRERGITSVTLPPSVLATLPTTDFPALRTVVSAGEACSLPIVRRWQAGRRFVNAYGPTEATVATTCAELTGTEPAPFIGRPLPHKEIYVLDAQLRPVPVGAPGELCIGGTGLALGYLGRPELTAERFVAHPFDERPGTPGARLYRTGDLVRYHDDGQLVYLGRIDHQVKVRGFRIELGEIESVLAQQRGVREAAVVARPVADDKRLTAYLIPERRPAPSLRELRRHLKRYLPAYMIPVDFIVMDAFPLTPNGKIDYPALPVPERPDGKRFIPPRTPVEELLAELWAELLGVSQVSANDNFFELGGHSLLATKLVARLYKALDLEVPLQVVFEEPTLAAMAGRLTILRQAAAEVPPAPPLTRHELDGPAPLSFGQQRLWYLAQLLPDSSMYNVHTAVRIHGPLDPALLERSLNLLVERHGALRTTFPTENGLPQQVVAASIEVSLPVIDLRGLAPAAQKTAVAAQIQELAEHTFDLAHGPLLHTRLLRRDEEEHIFAFAMHHIITDAGSNQIFLRDLVAIWRAIEAEQPVELPPLPIAYTDYAIWQREWLQDEVLERQLDYWRERLADAPDMLVLPSVLPRPSEPSDRGAAAQLTLSRALASSLKQLARQEGVTLFMLMLAAFKTLLYRLSGQDDIVVGTPIANRSRAEVENLIGFFINTLALRTDLSGNPSFRALLRRVRSGTLEAYAHQDLPFEVLVDALQVRRDLGRNPLFQVLFTVQSAASEELDVDEEIFEMIDPQITSAQFDLSVDVAESAGALHLSAIYREEVFDAASIERLLSYFRVLLEGVVADVKRPIVTLPVMPESERERVLRAWNATETDDSKRACIHQMFAAQVERTPEATALRFEGETMSYAELNRRANRLAHALRDMEVRPEMLVGVCMERSFEMVIALYAILKAGGAYVPLDPTYPPERLEFMVDDAQVSILLIQRHLLERLPPHDAQVICLDAPDAVDAEYPESNPDVPLHDENAAYMIYTSGSTGRPKGVINRHGAIRNRLQWMQETFELTEADRVLQKTPFSFDVSVWEFFWPLMYGATLVIARPEGHKDNAYLIELVQREGITTMHFVPSMLQMFVAQPGVAECTGLRRVICSGEALPYDLQERFFAQLPAELHNLYGPTEAAVDVTHWPCQRESDVRVVPIGYPIANIQIYILDPQMQPAPVGVTGALYIGGAGLARGYHRRPALTAERFIPHPYGDAGARLYRTGDLARYRADGSIEFVGRVDFQVKVRGFRIELGEIEAVLAGLPQVREAVVVVHAEQAGDTRLVAYVAPAEAAGLDVPEVLAALKERLPEYMIPAVVIPLEEFPLTTSGKVNRKALPSPRYTREGSAEAYRPPRNFLEQRLAEIWQEVLGVEQVGIDDNFFDLGGNSLLGMQVMAKAARSGIHFSVHEFMVHQTIAALFTIVDENIAGIDVFQALQADRIRALRDPTVPATNVVRLQVGGERPPLFLMHPAGGGVIGYKRMVHHLGPTFNVYGLESPDLYREEPELTDMHALAEHYIEQVRAVQPEGPYYLAGWSFGGAIAFEMASQLCQAGDEVAFLGMVDTGLKDPPALMGVGLAERSAVARGLAKIGGKRAIYGLSSLLWKMQKQRIETEMQRHDQVALLMIYVHWLEENNAKSLDLDTEELLALSLEERFVLLRERMEDRGFEAVEPQFNAVRQQVVVGLANARALARYEPEVYPGRVVFFKAERSEEERRFTPEDFQGPALGWSPYVEEEIEIIPISGTHNELQVDPHAAELAAKLQMALERAQDAPEEGDDDL